MMAVAHGSHISSAMKSLAQPTQYEAVNSLWLHSAGSLFFVVLEAVPQESVADSWRQSRSTISVQKRRKVGVILVGVKSMFVGLKVAVSWGRTGNGVVKLIVSESDVNSRKVLVLSLIFGQNWLHFYFIAH
jgi:hypothetical protein